MSAKLPERTYWSVNAHGHMEISGVYVEALEAAYANAMEALVKLAERPKGHHDCSDWQAGYGSAYAEKASIAEAALRSLPVLP